MRPTGVVGRDIQDSALWRPRFATPAIVALDTASNRQFTAEVRASAAATGWSVTVSNDLRAWTCPVISATYSTINRGTEPGWRIQAAVPADTSPELFTLVVGAVKASASKARQLGHQDGRIGESEYSGEWIGCCQPGDALGRGKQPSATLNTEGRKPKCEIRRGPFGFAGGVMLAAA